MTSAPLFAVRTMWVVILILIVVISLLWFFVRVVADAVTWFREEVLYDIQEHRRKKQAQKAEKKAEKKTEDDQTKLPE